MMPSRLFRPVLFSILLAGAARAELPAPDADGWISLFDGKTLAGWKASEHPDSIKVVDGVIRCDGPRAHLFYYGPDGHAQFENFEFTIEVRADPGANSGVYFHTAWEDAGWPTKSGFEVQVNNAQPPFGNYEENKKTGSLYGIRNVYKAMVRDGEWFTLHVTVRRPRVVVEINGRPVVDYVEPANAPEALHRLGQGTFALQCHDEKSKVSFRNFRVKPLPPGEDPAVQRPVFSEQDLRRLALGKDNFPLVDLHTHLKGGLTLAQVLALGDRTGMKAGIATNGGVGFPIQNDAAALAFLEIMRPEPVFVALQAEGREWMKMFTPETRAQFDYIFTDAMTWTNRAGRRLRLWIPEETDIGPDVQAFMEELTAQAVTIISTEPIDIYVNPTYLPDAIAARYDELWTEERMSRIIRAAVDHGVAIEINARYKLPSEKFIRLAKAAGAKFTIGTNNTSAADYGDWSYPMEMQQKTGLTWRNMWIPGHRPSRARRELAH